MVQRQCQDLAIPVDSNNPIRRSSNDFLAGYRHPHRLPPTIYADLCLALRKNCFVQDASVDAHRLIYFIDRSISTPLNINWHAASDISD